MIPLVARRRALLAASQTETTSPRDAAIVGGIVRSLIDTGGCDRGRVARYAVGVIIEFKLVGVDRTPPGPTEYRMVLNRFERAYGRRLDA
jgi:hypothetical protein